jgi:hypothetical protein
MADQELRRALHTFAVYRHRFEEEHPPVLEPGGALLADETVCSLEPPYMRAWFALTVVENHVQALDALWRDNQFANAGPAFTLARTPFIGACTAYWILQPDSSEERVIRALRVVHKDLTDSQGRFKDFLNDPALQGQDHKDGRRRANEGLQDMQERVSRVRSALAELGGSTKFAETELVMETFEAMGESAGDPWTRLLGLDTWRRASGAAHARRWVVAGIGEQYTDPYGRKIERSAYERSDLARLVVTTAHIYEQVWKRWDELNRSGGPRPFG